MYSADSLGLMAVKCKNDISQFENRDANSTFYRNKHTLNNAKPTLYDRKTWVSEWVVRDGVLFLTGSVSP